MLNLSRRLSTGVRVLWAVAAASASLLPGAGANGQRSVGGGTVTLHAAVIIVTANQITATGSPVLTSDQGTVQAPQFSVTLDREGRASLAEATGGVRFRLNVGAGSSNPGAPSSREVLGSCNRVQLYPGPRRVRLLGSLQGVLQGAGQAPVQLNGADQADILAALPGRPFRIEMTGASSAVSAHI